MNVKCIHCGREYPADRECPTCLFKDREDSRIAILFTAAMLAVGGFFLVALVLITRHR